MQNFFFHSFKFHNIFIPKNIVTIDFPFLYLFIFSILPNNFYDVFCFCPPTSWSRKHYCPPELAWGTRRTLDVPGSWGPRRMQINTSQNGTGNHRSRGRCCGINMYAKFSWNHEFPWVRLHQQNRLTTMPNICFYTALYSILPSQRAEKVLRRAICYFRENRRTHFNIRKFKISEMRKIPQQTINKLLKISWK